MSRCAIADGVARALLLASVLLLSTVCCLAGGATDADIDKWKQQWKENVARANATDTAWNTALGRMEVIKCHKDNQQEFWLLIEESCTPKPGVKLDPIGRVRAIRETGVGGHGVRDEKTLEDARTFVSEWMAKFGYEPGWPGESVLTELNGILEVKQAITPPERMIDVVKEIPAAIKEHSPGGGPRSRLMEKLLRRGTAVLTLEFRIDGLPDGADGAVTVSFEIDPPSTFVDSAARVPLSAKKAAKRFKFEPSSAAGQDGAIFARVRYPRHVVERKGVFEASRDTKTATLRITPLCDAGNSVFYADNLVNDITRDLESLKREFASAIDKYGKEKVDASAYSCVPRHAARKTSVRSSPRRRGNC